MPVIVQERSSHVVVLNKQSVAKIAARGPQGAAGPEGQPGQSGADGAGQIPARLFHWGDAPQVVFTPAVAGILTIARIQYTEPFNGVGAAVRVGTSGSPEAAMPADWNNPYSVYEFENSPDLPLDAGESLVLAVTPGTASQGAGLLFLTFIPNA